MWLHMLSLVLNAKLHYTVWHLLLLDVHLHLTDSFHHYIHDYYSLMGP